VVQQQILREYIPYIAAIVAALPADTKKIQMKSSLGIVDPFAPAFTFFCSQADEVLLSGIFWSAFLETTDSDMMQIG